MHRVEELEGNVIGDEVIVFFVVVMESIQFTCHVVPCQWCISTEWKFSSGIGLDLFALILLVCCTPRLKVFI